MRSITRKALQFISSIHFTISWTNYPPAELTQLRNSNISRPISRLGLNRDGPIHCCDCPFAYTPSLTPLRLHPFTYNRWLHSQQEVLLQLKHSAGYVQFSAFATATTIMAMKMTMHGKIKMPCSIIIDSNALIFYSVGSTWLFFRYDYK